VDPERRGPALAGESDEELQRLIRESRRATLRLRWPWVSLGVLCAFFAVALATLVAAAHPGWRIGLVAGCFALQGAPLVLFALRGTKPMALGQYPPGALSVGLVHLATATLVCAMTGGMRSPILVSLPPVPITALGLYGAAWQARLLLGVAAAAVAVLAALPPEQAGPPLPDWAFRTLAAAALVTTIAVTGLNLRRQTAAHRASGQELARVREELASYALARARTLEEVGAKVAHELKNPLTAVKALAQVGALGVPEAKARVWFGVVESEVARMQGILAEYLTFARPLQELRPEPVKLGPLVSDVLAVLSARAHKAGVREAAQGDASVRADPRRLKEALLNLVDNAIEATPPGGLVEVLVGQEGGQARIAVRDTGRGMPPEVLARIGTPFFTTREHGTGLGVVLARSVFTQHGGALRFESAPGRGTTAIATLPFVPAARSDHGEPALRR
jgi:two-component system sensor histidine kinase HydH